MPARDRPAVTVEPIVGHRIVGEPEGIDGIFEALPAAITGLRFAPDEALIIGGSADSFGDAIVEPETGFVAVTVETAVVARHAEWTLPEAGSFAQGAVAGVPVKLTSTPDGQALVIVYAAYLHDLLDRLT